MTAPPSPNGPPTPAGPPAPADPAAPASSASSADPPVPADQPAPTVPGSSASSAGPAAWGARDVYVWYGKKAALSGVTLIAPAGQVTAVVGGDGAGKTTLLRCLAGSLAASSGTVSRPVKERAGYFPAASGIYPDLTVAENLDFRAQGYRLPRQVARERAAEYLDRAGLASAAGRLAGQLSGGMRQKLAVIVAMLHHPDLLVLDEPTTGVDPVSRSGLWWLIARAAAEGCAVVLATTYLDEAERCARVLVLDAGTSLASGTPDEIIAAMPGALRPVPAKPSGDAAARAWRRGGRWRVWEPDSPSGVAPGVPLDVAAQRPAERIEPDLQDAVTVAAIARELSLAAPVRESLVRESPARESLARESPAQESLAQESPAQESREARS